ncbi:MAG: EamA family transporter, partial [Spirochaetes bacterium]|nr:EamA family transporter [Spirochaetota bacterium]
MVENVMQQESSGRSPVLVVASYLTVYVVWGSTYFFIKRSVATIPPFAVLAIRWTVGGVLLLAIAAATGRLRRMPSAREIASAAALATLLLILGNGMITASERQVDSYMAALLTSSAPLVVTLFDRVLLRQRLTLVRVLGVVLGFGGVALLLYDGQSLASSLDVPVLLGLAGVLFWGLATSLGHRFPVHGDNTVNSGIQMLFTGVVSLAITLLAGNRPAEIAAAMSGESLFGVAYLAVIGSIAFSAYTYLVKHEPAERVVSYALVNPLIALVLGLAVGHESPKPLIAVGSPLILVGLGFMLYGERLAGWLRRRRAAPAPDRSAGP